ncbi:MAG: dipeptidyl carboxypeptidase II, partial [Luteimonas sp.]
MKHPLTLALAAALAGATALPALAQTPANESAVSQTTEAKQANPFFNESTLPLRYPHFDRVDDADFAPAFDAGMARNLEEVEAIANNPQPPTFDNTMIPLEEAGELLGRATSVFFNLVGTDTNDARKKLQADYAAKFAAHRDAIALNPKLYARIKALHDKRDSLGLDAEGVRLIERYHTNFVRAGANRPEKDKTRLKVINGELAALGTKFSQN